MAAPAPGARTWAADLPAQRVGRRHAARCPRPSAVRTTGIVRSSEVGAISSTAPVAVGARRGPQCSGSIGVRAARAIQPPSAAASNRFISPRKSATSGPPAARRPRSGGPTCTIRPSRITAMPVGSDHGLVLVVGDDHEGECRGVCCRAMQLELGLLAQLAVQRRHGLVEEQDARCGREGAGQGHALLLAAGELVGLARRQGPPASPGPAFLRPARAICALGTPAARSPKATFWATVRCGKRA